MGLLLLSLVQDMGWRHQVTLNPINPKPTKVTLNPIHPKPSMHIHSTQHLKPAKPEP